MPDPLFSMLIAVVTLLIFALAARRIAQARSWQIGLSIFLLRMLLMGCLGILFWQVYLSPEERLSDHTRNDKKAVVILQDQSLSMQFMADRKTTRHILAETTWKDACELNLSLSGKAAKIERMYYGRNLVRESDIDQLRNDATNMAQAMAEVMSRDSLRGILLVSDGASNDGAVPDHVLNWAANRELPVFAIHTGYRKNDLTDIVVNSVGCSPTNPRHITVNLACHNSAESILVKTELTIDRKTVSSRHVKLIRSQRLEVEVPEELSHGWHEFSVRVLPGADEITLHNNVKYGIFRVVPPRKIICMVSTAKVGGLHLVRLIRRLWPENTILLYPDEKADINTYDIRLAVFAGIRPAQVPKHLQRSILRGNTVCLLTDSLREWQSSWLGSLSPVTATLEEVNLLETVGTEGVVQKEPTPFGLESLSAEHLRLNFCHKVRERTGSRRLLSLAAGKQKYPLLLIDDPADPHCLALLSEATWRWALSPRPASRMAYKQLWSSIVDHIFADRRDEFGLGLTFEPGSEGKTRIRITPRNLQPTQIKDIRLQIERNGRIHPVTPVLQGNTWQYLLPDQPRPQVVWLQASARTEEKQLLSERTPLHLPVNTMELIDAQPHPEYLRPMVSGDDCFAFYEDRKLLLQKAFTSFTAAHTEYRKVLEERDSFAEMAIVFLCAIILAGEWFIERRAYARKS